MDKIKVGISSCLLGNKVRYDGQHKRDSFITETLGKWCEFIPVCPEVECGLSIPREAMRLVGDQDSQRLLTWKTGVDHTERMLTWSKQKCLELANQDIVAFIFKSKSPSSGLRNVKIFGEKGQPTGLKAQGLFAKVFTEQFPLIPVEDEGRLNDPGIRENFVETIFVLQRWTETIRGGSSTGLVDFHSRHKYTFMAHSQSLLKQMGKLVAKVGIEVERRGDLFEEYEKLLLELLSEGKTVKNNYNTLLHIFGYFKEELSDEEKVELQAVMEDYHRELTPILVPLTLIKHYSHKYRKEYLLDQYFLNPHPIEMKLLNHV